MDNRTFLYGCIVGIYLTIGSFVAVCEIADIKWQPRPHASVGSAGPWRKKRRDIGTATTKTANTFSTAT